MMEPMTMLYILNATLLLLHEIESAFEREWDILKLPGKITGFMLFHIPIILFLLYGLIEIEKYSRIGLIFGVVTGLGGIIPFIVHKIVVRTPGHFNRIISNVVIYSNVFSGVGLLLSSLRYFA